MIAVMSGLARGIACGHRVDAVAGGLYSFAATPPEFVGGFLLDPTGDAVSVVGLENAEGNAAACVGEPGRIFVTGNDSGANGLRRFSEFEIPEIVPGTDMAARNVGARVQGYRNLTPDFDLASYPDDEDTATIGGMYYDPLTGRLHVGSYKYYDNYSGIMNHFVYEDAANLAGARSGPSVLSAPDDGAVYRSCGFWGGQIIPLPDKWHSVFGGTHLVHNGRRVAIASRASIGPSAASLTPGNIEAGIAKVLMRFTLEHPQAQWEDSTSGTTECLTDPLWNHVSHCAFAFVIPGTDTLCYIGHNIDRRIDDRGNNTIGYHDTNSEGHVSSGYDPYWADAYAGYYWLYDLNALAQTAADPAAHPFYSHQPYEHGYFDVPVMDADWRRNIWGGCFNHHTNQLIVTVGRGAEPRFNNGVSSYEVFNLPGLSS